MDWDSNIGTLEFHFFRPWHVSTGTIQNNDVLSTCRDPIGVPILPGTIIKGIFRCCAGSMSNCGLLSRRLIEEQFGSQPSNSRKILPTKGALVFGNARPVNAKYNNEKFYTIPCVCGEAVTHYREFAPPMNLVSLVMGNDESVSLLHEVSRRITAIGVLRSEGYGQVKLEYVNGCSVP